jgi:uncharacterized protein YbjT (DUF2867 family)
MHIAIAGAGGTVGHHVARVAKARAHEVIPLGRTYGVDLTDTSSAASAHLSEVLDGVHVIVDVCNAPTIEEEPATSFFTTVAANLQRAAADRHVSRVVTLSIVGIDDADFGYYRAKVAHERAAAAGPVPSTVVRATQLHELPGQLIGMTRGGGHAMVFDAPAQTVAASAVGETLVGIATSSHPHETRAEDLTGPPPPANLAELGRAFVRHRGATIEVDGDTELMSGIPEGGLLPGPDARVVGPTFEEWLTSEDAAALPI